MPPPLRQHLVLTPSLHQPQSSRQSQSLAPPQWPSQPPPLQPPQLPPPPPEHQSQPMLLLPRLIPSAPDGVHMSCCQCPARPLQHSAMQVRSIEDAAL